ncbi:YrhC family protein [Heyndrickxia acidiproducens]|uniref:YrhC family protein n=1 Tax=Heyndrickxia acidiproducens TaxID=1121084 RepID=UPI000361D535|nr:YrhC family protein [Heyndrickxia acidiproducens]
MKKAKTLYGKMVDFKLYGIVLVAMTGFLYLGAVMPIEGKSELGTKILLITSSAFIAASALFFTVSRKYHQSLMKSEEGIQLLHQKLNRK